MVKIQSNGLSNNICLDVFEDHFLVEADGVEMPQIDLASQLGDMLKWYNLAESTLDTLTKSCNQAEVYMKFWGQLDGDGETPVPQEHPSTGDQDLPPPPGLSTSNQDILPPPGLATPISIASIVKPSVKPAQKENMIPTLLIAPLVDSIQVDAGKRRKPFPGGSKNQVSIGKSFSQPEVSAGSIGHPESCGEACKYARRPRGCKDGVACTRCHLCKWTRYGFASDETRYGVNKVCGLYERNKE